MKLIALLLAVVIERGTTSLFDLGELRWLDRYFDKGLGAVRRYGGWAGFAIALVVIALPVVPVAWVAIAFRDVLWGGAYIGFAVAVLLFSLGPRDLSSEVDDFVRSTRRGDDERARHVARELLETEPPQDRTRRTLAIEEAIFVQASHRTFSVILWFALLGPAGAWLFRVTDLLRRRAFFEADRVRDEGQAYGCDLFVTQQIHGVLAWLPARLVALTFALAGSFEPAVADWRGYYQDMSERFFDVNDDIVARSGLGALGATPDGDEAVEVRGALAAMSLVRRSEVIWLVAFAVLTIIGALA
ncbi:MAG: regulatory signaling modulator protein AmpE [Pseudomonadota bacterium]